MDDAEIESLVQRGQDVLHENKDEYIIRRSRVEGLMNAGRFNAAAAEAEITAFFADGEHVGMYFSPVLEGLLRKIGIETVTSASRVNERPSSAEHVLHVVTDVAHIGGIPRLLRRWITIDTSRTYSLCLTGQHRSSVPDAIVDVVERSGGQIHVIGGARGGLVERAQLLNRLAAEVDVVVVHGWECDPVPVIAFADARTAPPLMQVNHGDGKFWLRASPSAVVVNLRRSGARLTVDRRGVDAGRSVVVPTPIDPAERTVDRLEAKRRCGLDPTKTTLLSVARWQKYRPFNGVGFADTFVPFLERHPGTQLVVVGPGEAWDFSEAEKKVPGQIRVLAETEDTAMLYQAADVYVDSFPFVSNTSLLEAGSYATPLITRQPFASEHNGVYGADLPGLDGRMISTRSMAEFESELSSLVLDDARRTELGRATRDQIVHVHSGEEWLRSLDAAYSLALSIPPTESEDAPIDDEFHFGEPDAIAPAVYGHGFNSGWILRFVSGSMDLRQRIHYWRTWRADEGHVLGLSFLLPDWLKHGLRRAEHLGRIRLSGFRRIGSRFDQPSL